MHVPSQTHTRNTSTESKSPSRRQSSVCQFAHFDYSSGLDPRVAINYNKGELVKSAYAHYFSRQRISLCVPCRESTVDYGGWKLLQCESLWRTWAVTTVEKDGMSCRV